MMQRGARQITMLAFEFQTSTEREPLSAGVFLYDLVYICVATEFELHPFFTDCCILQAFSGCLHNPPLIQKFPIALH